MTDNRDNKKVDDYSRETRRSFRDRLRDVFAVVGLCDSTKDLARRPDLLAQVFAQSAGYGHHDDAQVKPVVPYDDRLRAVLDGVATYTLDRLVQEKVAVCLDTRQAAQDVGFWNNTMLAVFYNRPDEKVVALYDNGKGQRESGFFERTALDWGRGALNVLVRQVLDRPNGADLYVGTTHTRSTGKTTSTYFKWHEAESYFARELKRNPALRAVPRAPAP